MSFAVSHNCIEAVRARLADPAAGLNRWFADLHQAHGVAKAWRLNWDRSKSTNVVMGNVDVPEMVAEAGTLKYDPLIISIFGANSANTQREKYFAFSGQALVQVDVYHAWGGKAPLDDAGVASLIESALYATFGGDWPESCDETTAYTGQISVVPGPIQRGAKNWIQLVTARLAFEVSARL